MGENNNWLYRKKIRSMKILTALFHFVLHHENWCFLVFFAIIVCFVDSNSLWERHYVWESTDNLRAEIDDYKARFQEDSLKLDALKNDPRQLVKVAREKYLMTRPGEDLFLIQEEAAPLPHEKE